VRARRRIETDFRSRNAIGKPRLFLNDPHDDHQYDETQPERPENIPADPECEERASDDGAKQEADKSVRDPVEAKDLYVGEYKGEEDPEQPDDEIADLVSKAAAR